MRKFSAHFIFPGSGPPLKFGIVVTDDDGKIRDLIDTGGKMKEERNLEFYPGILVPGFINAHCHLELSHLAGRIPEHTGLSGFIGLIVGIRKEYPDVIQKEALNQDLSMYHEGISGIGDISNNSFTIPVKQSSKIRYHNFVEFFSLDPENANEIFNDSVSLRNLFRLQHLDATLSPHSGYSISKTLWLRFSNELNRESLLTIHHDESVEERQLYSDQSGPLAERFKSLGYHLENLPDELPDYHRLFNRFAPDPVKLWVHNTISGTDDLPAGPMDKNHLVVCPGSNLYIENKLPDFDILMKSGLPICIGTDSLASNKRLSMVHEMRLIQQANPNIPFEMILRWATLNGALALGMQDELGSFEKGKKPGIVHIQVFDFINMKLHPQSKAVRML